MMYVATKSFTIGNGGRFLKAGDPLSEEELRRFPALRGAVRAGWLREAPELPDRPCGFREPPPLPFDPIEHANRPTWHAALLEADPL